MPFGFPMLSVHLTLYFVCRLGPYLILMPLYKVWFTMSWIYFKTNLRKTCKIKIQYSFLLGLWSTINLLFRIFCLHCCFFVLSVLRSTLCLLQDEEEDIRSIAAKFAAVISEPAGSVTCSAAIQLVLQFMAKHFWSVPGCWVAMETMIRGPKSTQDVLKDYVRAK